MCSSLILFLIRYFRCHILAGITYGLGILSLFLLLTPFFCGQVLIFQLSKACGNLAIQFNKLCSLTKRFKDISFVKSNEELTCRADHRVVLVSRAALAKSAKASARSRRSSFCGGRPGGGQGSLRNKEIRIFQQIFKESRI